MQKKTCPVFSYFLLNFLLVNGCVAILFSIMGAPGPWFVYAALISVPIIFVQYFLLRKINRRWIHYLVYYGSMLLFLFLFGIAVILPSANPAKLFKSGFWMMIYGHVFGGPLVLLLIIAINGFFSPGLFKRN